MNPYNLNLPTSADIQESKIPSMIKGSKSIKSYLEKKSNKKAKNG